ncbi:P-loop containing nucleoside triphosphate hydrolase protein [Pluteus cervinus]|uniref:P-loop containing nucleoside triphosphate hydrolase protein n=1 Tax=Pluteus cervinus TaxID=181527 RepID=A0ACD3B2S3_9AGAR|nr:P-loop containing nucleoside triphosphate hydrolase protein [Pluteus cervinus]
MSSPTSTNTEEKTTIIEPKARRSFFHRKKEEVATNRDQEKAAAEDGSTASPTEEGKKAEIPPVSFAKLFRFATTFELFLNFAGLVAAIGAGAAQPLMTLFFGKLTQSFITFQVDTTQLSMGIPIGKTAQELEDDFKRSAAQLASYLVFMGLALLCCTFVYMYTWTYTAEANAKRIRERYLGAVLRQDIQFFDKVGAGEITTRIQTDTHLVQQGISEKVPLVVRCLSAFVTGYVMAYVRSWRLALALTSILPCITLTGAVMNVSISKYTQLTLKHVAEAGSLAEEVISTIRTTQAFGIQYPIADLYDHHIESARHVDLKTAIWTGGGIATFFFIVYSAYGLAFSFGITLINSGHADAGQVINVFLAILIGSFSLAMLAPEMQAIIQGCGAAAKLFETIDCIPEIDSADPGGERPTKVEGEIELCDVKFNYPSRPSVEILKGLSLTFHAGKTSALVGASGSGKSTIIALIERFYDPLSGLIKLDGVDIRQLNVKWFRSQMGLVSQEPTLFGTTIKENVAHGLVGTAYENAPEEEKFKLIKEACIKANADGFISKLPNGYETMVGERGFLLSGGQKQRVAIARAIVSDPRILLLDEATSALDTQSEGIVQDALEKAAAGRTTITIAHRLSTIKDADVIYVMGEGSVLESGTHDELLAKEGAYAILVQAQSLREDKGSKDRNAYEEEAAKEVPLGRTSTSRSLASEVLADKEKHGSSDDKQGDVDHGFVYLFKRMGKLNRESWNRYLTGCVFAIMTGAIYPSFGIVFSKGIDAFAQEPEVRRKEGDRVALWLFIIAIVSMLATFFQNYMFMTSAARLTAKLRTLSFRAILRQDIEFFDRDENTTGKLTVGLSEKPQKVNGLAGATLAAIVQNIATIIIGSVLGLVFVWKIALISIACLPFLLSPGYIHLRVVVLKDKVNKAAHEASATIACEAASSIRTVASLTREDDCLFIYSKALEEPLHRSARSAFWSTTLYSLSQAFVFFLMALLFWFGAILVAEGEYSSFDFFVGMMSTTFAAMDASGVFAFVPDMSTAKGAASDIVKLLDMRPDIDAESPDGKKVDGSVSRGRIELKNIHFRYPTRPGVRVLRDLSLSAEPGTFVALVGQSGCGKSTVIQLIERFYDPMAGDVLFDDQPISELNIQEYRKQISLVSQEPTLYAGTIRFNILLGAAKPTEEVTQDEIEAVCRDANILEFIKELPDGFETQVGGKGSQLSGGQKQRIAIARALLRNPKVLLLDEATSALDSTSERVVQEALDQAAKGRTTIAIAHRLSTIQNADQIYFIKEGRVSESGTHEQLLAQRGDYYTYVQLQGLSRRE